MRSSWLITVGAVRRYLDDQSEEVIGHIYGVLSLFLIGPWIIRRTVRLNFPDFHLVAIRQPGGEETRTISYRESLNVAWLLAWRSALVGGLVYGAIFLALWALRGAPPSGFQRPVVSGVLGLILWVVYNLLCLLLLYLWLVSAAIRKTYSDFVLQLRETSPARAAILS